jgi:hypothetical protein
MTTAEHYYDEFIRYYWMADKQQAACNLGMEPYKGSVDDPLMEAVELYDVVERKYAGFSQLVNDCFYGWTPKHPYWAKMEAGVYSEWWHPRQMAKQWNDMETKWSNSWLANWLYVFLVHRLTGSGINYAKKPSGYNNTIVPQFYDCDSIEDMADAVLVGSQAGPIFTSVGYQFPAFPKPAMGYAKGGVYFMREMLPDLARKLAQFLEDRYTSDSSKRVSLREVGEFMFAWNAERGLRAYRFQYAAVIADICDWFPYLVDRESPFYYGSNAVECISYLTGGKKDLASLDAMMRRIYDDTGSLPYNAEDVCCDYIRWCENYVRPGADYNHLDRDTLFSSCTIRDHPYGRQKAMLDLGLIESFNDLSVHPSDDYVISRAGIKPDDYRRMVT